MGVPVENGHALSELEMFEVEILTNLLKKLTVGLQTYGCLMPESSKLFKEPSKT